MLANSAIIIINIISKAHQGKHANADLNTFLVNYVSSFLKLASKMISMFGIFRSFHVHIYRSREEGIFMEFSS